MDLASARILMAVSLAFHIVFACLGVGFPVLLLAAEGLALRTGDAGWRTLARRWSKAFAVLFAVGAVSGTILSFELGLLWPGFMGTFGGVIGLPFTLEAFAFFIEGIFLGIYLYGWDRLPPRVHWLCGVPIAAAGLASALFVVTANAWMNCPRGFTLRDGRVVDADPVAAMLNPASAAQAAHMALAAYVVAGFLVAAVYAAGILRGRDGPHERRALGVALALACAALPFQIFAGDRAAKVVARTQPAKFAAMEGQFATQARAPLRVGGWPDEAEGRTKGAVEIPGGLSWLAHGDSAATVQGLHAFPPDERPPVAPVHVSFQIMVGGGSALFLFALWAAALALRRKPLPRSFLFAAVAAGPLSVACLEAGWVVTEMGRQPWIVTGVMRTRDAVTSSPGIPLVLACFLAAYVVLSAGTVAALRFLARRPDPGDTRVP